MINTNCVALQFIMCLSLDHLHLIQKSLSSGTLFELFTCVSSVEWLLLLNHSVPKILEMFLSPLLEKTVKFQWSEVWVSPLILGPTASMI